MTIWSSLFHLEELEAWCAQPDPAQLRAARRAAELRAGHLRHGEWTAQAHLARLALTRKEKRILEYLLLNQGRPVSQEELMEHVWDGSVDSFSNSIRVHISSLRKKLKAALGYDPILNRIGEGYLMGGQEA